MYFTKGNFYGEFAQTQNTLTKKSHKTNTKLERESLYALFRVFYCLYVIRL